jgi:hypothetical protein
MAGTVNTGHDILSHQPLVRASPADEYSLIFFFDLYIIFYIPLRNMVWLAFPLIRRSFRCVVATPIDILRALWR